MTHTERADALICWLEDAMDFREEHLFPGTRANLEIRIASALEAAYKEGYIEGKLNAFAEDACDIAARMRMLKDQDRHE